MFWIIAVLAVLLMAALYVWAGRRTSIRNVRKQGIDNAVKSSEGQAWLIRGHDQAGPGVGPGAF